MFRLGWGKILPDSGESKCWFWQGYDAQTPVRDGTCRPVGSFFVSAGDPKGCRGRAESPLQAAACKKIPAGGLTRRLRRGRWGCRPEGGSTFFRSERKYQRKHAARRLREKALYCPFLKEGVRNVARNEDGQLSPAFGARSCSLLSSFKKGKAFSLRCLSPLCSPAVGGGQAYPLRGGMLRCDLRIFATQKASVKSKSCWPLQRAMRPVAEWRSESAKRQGAAPDPRAARPVAERR